MRSTLVNVEDFESVAEDEFTRWETELTPVFRNRSEFPFQSDAYEDVSNLIVTWGESDNKKLATRIFIIQEKGSYVGHSLEPHFLRAVGNDKAEVVEGLLQQLSDSITRSSTSRSVRDRRREVFVQWPYRQLDEATESPGDEPIVRALELGAALAREMAEVPIEIEERLDSSSVGESKPIGILRLAYAAEPAKAAEQYRLFMNRWVEAVEMKHRARISVLFAVTNESTSGKS